MYLQIIFTSYKVSDPASIHWHAEITHHTDPIAIFNFDIFK